MTETCSARTDRTESMAAKLAFRGRRAIGVAAAVIAFGLFTAPLQAQQLSGDQQITNGECLGTLVNSVSLNATVGTDNIVKLVTTVTPAITARRDRQSGIQYRYKEPEDTGWSQWETVSLEAHYWTPFHGNGPYSFKARAWTYMKVYGEWCALVTDPTDVVTVTKPATE